MKIPTKEEIEEIEISSRFWEEENSIKINIYFLVEEYDNVFNENVSFILKERVLVSIRQRELSTFSEISRKITTNPRQYRNCYDVLAEIISTRIDRDADMLEKITREISKLNKFVFTGVDITEDILETFSYYEDYNMTIRETLVDKQRIISAILKSHLLPVDVKEEFKIMIKDVGSLISYTNFNFEKLNYLQNTFLGLINLEQNKIIKALTLMSVILLPPTLIASIYGMNFRYMPELDWKFGYFYALLTMLISVLLSYLFFKRKGSV